MAPFKEDPEEWQRIDWQLLQNSPITLYFRRAVLDEHAAWFADHGYRVLSLEAGRYGSPEKLLVALGRLFQFPEYYGRNLAAFQDCLSDVEVPETGLVLVMHGFDEVARKNGPFAQAVLDVCADISRRFLLTGQRFLVLIQSDDPRLTFEPVGRTTVLWNPQEWLSSSRGL
ncbi:MAG TPA: barstar family protein [Thermoanaerobaculia bacterium]|nr:barstar family protein [Thermoanaerobaculia bacterium]